MLPKLWIWNNFKKCDAKCAGKVQCGVCNQKLSAKGGNASLRYHIEKVNLKDESSDYRLILKAKLPTSAGTADKDNPSTSSASIKIVDVDADDQNENKIDTSSQDTPGRLLKKSIVKERGAIDIESQGQSVLTQWVTSSRHRPCTPSRVAELTKFALQCVVKDLQPISFSEDPGMHSWLLYVEPNYQPP